VPELFLTGPAQEGIGRLEGNPAFERLLGRVNEALDLVERRPGSAEARRLRFRDPPSWGIGVSAGDHDFIVTWMSAGDFAAWADPAGAAALSSVIGDDVSSWAIVLYVGPRPR
jgi:hypothetical protein